jgi:hypothetical protein
VPQQPALLACHISLNGPCDEWYWDVTGGGEIIARGLAPSQKQARIDAAIAATSYRVNEAEQAA